MDSEMRFIYIYTHKGLAQEMKRNPSRWPARLLYAYYVSEKWKCVTAASNLIT